MFLCAFPVSRWRAHLKSVYICFVLLNVTTHSFLSPFSLSFSLVSPFSSLRFSFTLSHPSHSLKTCHFAVCLYLYPFFFFPPSSPPPSSLLQVVKWILLSQSHQGKSRKRKRIEPKVNYKEVGDTQLYYRLYVASLCSTSNSWKCTFYLLETSISIWVYCSIKIAVIFWAEQYFCLSDNTFIPQFCLYVVLYVSVKTDYLVLV